MNKKTLAACCTVLFTSVLAINAARADEPLRGAQAAGTPNAAGGISYRAKLLLGATVNLDGGSSAGTIDDIIIDDAGNVEYLVVINAQRQLVAIPWAASRYDTTQRVVFVRIAPERFRQIPTFTVDRYPVFAAPAFRTKVYGYFGLTPGQRRYINERSGRVDVKTGRIDFQGRDVDGRNDASRNPRDNDRQSGNATPRKDGTQPRTPAPRTDGTQPTTPDPRNDGTRPTSPAPRNDGKQPTTTAPRTESKDRDARPVPPAPKDREPQPKKQN